MTETLEVPVYSFRVDRAYRRKIVEAAMEMISASVRQKYPGYHLLVNGDLLNLQWVPKSGGIETEWYFPEYYERVYRAIREGKRVVAVLIAPTQDRIGLIKEGIETAGGIPVCEEILTETLLRELSSETAVIA